MTSALIIVDPQNDFCPGGALAVPRGDEVMPVLTDYAALFAQAGRLVVVSRDWHPAQTTHFKSMGGLWPAHCVHGTLGAEFHANLTLPNDAVIVSKGTGPTDDAYSAFQATDSTGATLLDILKRRDTQFVYIGGLATDYCVKATALDALKFGFATTVLLDGVRGVNVQPGDAERALSALVSAGVHVETLNWLKPLLLDDGTDQ